LNPKLQGRSHDQQLIPRTFLSEAQSRYNNAVALKDYLDSRFGEANAFPS